MIQVKQVYCKAKKYLRIYEKRDLNKKLYFEKSIQAAADTIEFQISV